MRITRKVFSIYSEEDLISAIEEKAFCEGYQAAQKEFGNKENKRKRREWEIKNGSGRNKNAELDEAFDINTSRFKNKNYVDQLDALKEQYRPGEYDNRRFEHDVATERREEVMKKEREKRAKELEEYKKRLAKTEAEPVPTVVKEGAEESGKNIEKGLSRFKKPALIGVGIVGTAGLAYGGKKLYVKYKNKKAE